MNSTSSKLETAVLEVITEYKSFERLPYWHDHTEETLRHELVACILGSQVSFEHASAAARYLSDQGLLDWSPFQNPSEKEYELRVAAALSRPIYPPFRQEGLGRQYRYPNIRANHIMRTFKNISILGGIKKFLIENQGSTQARIHLTKIIVGMGPKQSSLFLRNIGYADDLAILDKHVLDYMYALRISRRCFKAIPTLGFYEKIENKLLCYANSLRVSMSVLDTAIWVVMRVFKKGFNS